MSTLKANRFENTATTDGGITIDSSGRVGIGASSFNDTREVLRVEAPSGETGTFLTIKSPDTSGTSALFFGDNDFNEGRIQYDHSNNAMRFYTNDGERVRILSGGGITFNGDTAAVNALDDYEEGTFTPSYGTGVTSPGYDIQQGHYTKVGNLVSFSIGLRANSGTPNSSHLVITGLPFTTLNSANSEGSAMLVYNANIIGGNVTPTFYMPVNTVNIEVYTADGNSAWSGNTANDVQNRVLRLRGQYQTN